MLALGLDIGTTTVSAVVTDETGDVLDSLNRPHNAFLETPHPWERTQNPENLLETAFSMVETLCRKHRVSCIGVTGQQHGIVYLDREGRVLGPLYTWQDGRGNLPYHGTTYAAFLRQKTGCAMASGYGLVSHFYNLQNGLVPENAAVLTTIPDLMAMRLAGLNAPVTEPSDAQSLGFFDLEKGEFDQKALTACGINPAILPQVKRGLILGDTTEGIPVAVAIGDNAASFLGAVGSSLNTVLLNVGTGSQITVWTRELLTAPPLETRPFPLGGYLLVGAALCGGRAWAMTERFFSDAVFAFTGKRMELYDGLNRLLEETADDGAHPHVITTFDGTRMEPGKRASVENLSKDNFNPGQFALGVLYGMTEELWQLYRAYLDRGYPEKPYLMGSGNGLRLNRHLRRVTEKVFGRPLNMSRGAEEAAAGAAMFALTLTTKRRGL